MPTFKQLEDIIAWQKARTLCITLKDEFDKLLVWKEFKLLEQLRSSSGSVMDNIAEGFGRMGNMEFKNFLTIAHGSLMEALSQIYRVHDYGHITPDRLLQLKELIAEISRLIRSLIQHLIDSDLRGVKFK